MPNFNVPAWAKNKLIPTELDRVDLCPEGCNSAAFIKLIKEKKEDSTMSWEKIKKNLKEEDVAIIDAELKKAAKAAGEEGKKAGKAEMQDEMAGALNAKDEEIEGLKKKCGANSPKASEAEQMKKALSECDPVIKAMFEKMQAKEAAAEAAAKIAKEALDTEEATKIAKELQNLPAEETELVEVCKAIGTMGAHSEKIFTILKAAANITEGAVVGADGTVTPITKAIGAQGDGEIQKASVKFDNAVAEIQKEKNISLGDATMAIMKTKPELYYAYLNEQN